MRIVTIDISPLDLVDGAELLESIKDRFVKKVLVVPYRLWLCLTKELLETKDIEIVVLTDRHIYQDRTQTTLSVENVFKKYSDKKDIVFIPDTRNITEAINYSGTVVTLITSDDLPSRVPEVSWEICNRQKLHSKLELITWHRKFDSNTKKNMSGSRRAIETYLCCIVLLIIGYIFVITGGNV